MFAGLAILWSWPLAAHVSTHLPGNAAGDNVGFLWNVWWMRRVLDRPELSFFFTDRLFAPFGLDLTLHTHAALPSLAAAWMSSLSLIAALNIVILASLALNGWTAYLLAYDRTGDLAGALLAGFVFAASPYISTRLLGHFNLIAAWGIPLFLLLLLRARDRSSLAAAALAGVVAVLVAYTDYYYFVYCGLAALALLGAAISPIRVRFRRAAAPRPARIALLGLLAVDAALIAATLASGGFVTTIAGTTVTATRITNPLAFGWLILLLLALLHVRAGIEQRVAPPRERSRRIAVALVLLAVVLAGTSLLLSHALAVWRQGDYTAPLASWRSGPGGVDLATLVLGNPRHPLTGPWTAAVYDRLHIEPSESSGWLGLAPLVFVALAWHRYRRDREVRLWMAVGSVALVWALGPWLRVAGFDTGLLLPQNLAAHVPLLSNARVPGRAMVLVYLAAAMLMSIVIARAAARRRLFVAALALAVCAVDYLPAPFPLTLLRMPVIYADILAAGGDATVCELPVGVRDGLGSMGHFDDRVLFYQMVHEHPIVGGFAARVPERVKTGYREMPIIRSLFRLSAGQAADPRDAAATRADALAALRAAGIGYVMVNRELATPALVAFVQSRLPVLLARSDEERDLYLVTSAAATPAPPAR